MTRVMRIERTMAALALASGLVFGSACGSGSEGESDADGAAVDAAPPEVVEIDEFVEEDDER
jgi:hypothetical protein